MNATLLVRGEPYPFATNGERRWRQILEENVPHRQAGSNERGLLLELNYDPRMHGGHADIDNLCEPVFFVLVGQKGWFDGKRTNIQWWQATKREQSEGGVDISIAGTQAPPTDCVNRMNVIFDATYKGALPIHAKDQVFAGWVKEQAPEKAFRIGKKYSVQLQFGSPLVNIGQISYGNVKACIDCLYPIIGGVAGAPADEKIVKLQVAKGISGLAEGVKVIIEKL